MKAKNYNKEFGPDDLDGTILRPGDPSYHLTLEIIAQILGLLIEPLKIPKYHFYDRLVLLSKNKDKDKAEFI